MEFSVDSDHQSSNMEASQARRDSRRRLARIRCLRDCIECFRTSNQLPLSLCYIPKCSEFRTTRSVVVKAYAAPDTLSREVMSIACVKDHRVVVCAEEFCNSQGQWARLVKVALVESASSYFFFFLWSWQHLTINSGWVSEFLSCMWTYVCIIIYSTCSMIIVEYGLKRTQYLQFGMQSITFSLDSCWVVIICSILVAPVHSDA